MGWVKRKYRVVGVALSLLSIAFYALLIPGHLTSQFETQVRAAELGEFSGVICAGGSSPVMPASSCPICKGLATFQLALAAPEAASLPAMPHAQPALIALRDDAIGAAVPFHRSRGPPPLSA